MNKKRMLIPFFSVFLLINWSSQPDKQGAQFFGTLVTRPGNTFRVHNITIGRDKKTKKIPVYEKPKNSAFFNRVDDRHITLSVDPKDALAIIYLDLGTISRITVLNDTRWTYKSEKGYREDTYIEVEVTDKSVPVPCAGACPDASGLQSPSNNTPVSPQSYLIERDTYLECTQIDGKAPKKMKEKLSAINYLTIEGYLSEQEYTQPVKSTNGQSPCGEQKREPKQKQRMAHRKALDHKSNRS